MVGESSRLDALLHPSFLVHIALHIGLHALGRFGFGIALDVVGLGGVDVTAGLILGFAQLGALHGTEFSVLQVFGLQTIHLALFLFQAVGFFGVQTAVFQTIFDASLLVDIALDCVCGGLRKSGDGSQYD